MTRHDATRQDATLTRRDETRRRQTRRDETRREEKRRARRDEMRRGETRRGEATAVPLRRHQRRGCFFHSRHGDSDRSQKPLIVGAFISLFLVSGREGRVCPSSHVVQPRAESYARQVGQRRRDVPQQRAPPRRRAETSPPKSMAYVVFVGCFLRSALRGGVPNSVCMFADERPPSRPSRRQSSNSSTRSKQARSFFEQDRRKLTR